MQIIKISILIFFCSVLFAQNIPSNYELGSKRSLSKITSGNPSGNSTTDLALSNDIIWILTNLGLSKSTDNGLSWTDYADEDLMADNSVYFMDMNDGVLWVSVGHKEVLLGSEENVGAGLLYTTDEGVTWNHVDQPKDSEGDSLITYGHNTIRALPVTSDVNNITWDLEYQDGILWTASFAGGLRKSADMGQTWERVLLPSDDLDSIKPTDTLNYALQPVSGNFGPDNHLNHRVFCVEPVSKDTILVGTAGGINISFDGGISWKKSTHQNQTNAIVGNFVTNISYNPADKSIWASCRIGGGTGERMGVSYSYDFGENWTTILVDVKAHYIGFKGTDVFIPTDSRGLLRSTDQGVSWLEVGKIVDSSTNVAMNSLSYHVVKSIERMPNEFDIWIGSARGLVRLTETGTSDQDWRVFFETGEAKQVIAFPNPFRPGDDAINLKYFINKESSEVTIRVFDFGMNLVKTVVQNAPRYSSGEKIDTWDGRDESGEIVPNGVYFFRVDVDSEDPEFGKILIIK